MFGRLPLLITALFNGCDNNVEFSGPPAWKCDIQVEGHALLSHDIQQSSPITDIYVEQEFTSEGHFFYSEASGNYSSEATGPKINLTLFEGTASVEQGEPTQVACEDGETLACYEIECQVDPRDEILVLPE